MFDSAAATPMRDYIEAGLAGDFRRCAELYYKAEPIRQLHHKWVLEPWKRDGLCPISTIKSWTTNLGLTGGPVRPPLPSFPANQAAQLQKEMRAVGLVSAQLAVAAG
jgi:dihydrodipicolinate synthase/N-acetylneuraminate lyase